MSILYRVAVRNVFRNRRRSFFTLSTIILGLAVVLAITSISNSFFRFSVENAVNAKVGALQIHSTGYLRNVSLNPLNFNFDYTPELINKIKSVKGVRAASGRIVFRGLVSNGKNQALFFANAIDVEREQEVCPKWLGTITEGSQPLSPGDVGKAMVGQELARSLNVAPVGALDPVSGPSLGDSLNLSAASPLGRQNAVDVQVKATTRSTLPLEEKRSLTLPLPLAQSLLGLDGKVTEIAVAVDDIDDLQAVQVGLQAALGQEFEVSTWADVQPFLRDVLFRQRVMIGIVSFILFILAIFVIANTMTMAVFERTREIGTMLSVGVKRHQIHIIFFSEAVFVGVVGAFLGTCVGVLVVFVLNRTGIPFGSVGFERGTLYPFLEFGFTVAAFFIAVLCAAIAGIFPARRAADMNPVDALRAS